MFLNIPFLKILSKEIGIFLSKYWLSMSLTLFWNIKNIARFYRNKECFENIFEENLQRKSIFELKKNFYHRISYYSYWVVNSNLGSFFIEWKQNISNSKNLNFIFHLFPAGKKQKIWTYLSGYTKSLKTGQKYQDFIRLKISKE